MDSAVAEDSNGPTSPGPALGGQIELPFRPSFPSAFGTLRPTAPATTEGPLAATSSAPASEQVVTSNQTIQAPASGFGTSLASTRPTLGNSLRVAELDLPKGLERAPSPVADSERGKGWEGNGGNGRGWGSKK